MTFKLYIDGHYIRDVESIDESLRFLSRNGVSSRGMTLVKGQVYCEEHCILSYPNWNKELSCKGEIY